VQWSGCRCCAITCPRCLTASSIDQFADLRHEELLEGITAAPQAGWVRAAGDTAVVLQHEHVAGLQQQGGHCWVGAVLRELPAANRQLLVDGRATGGC